MMTDPADPITAVTHPDPYGWYGRLVAERPVHRDTRHGFWVAASAEAVTAVLTSADCRVRPAAEPVPAALLGSAAGDIFGRLVRMNDGERHHAVRQAVAATLAAVDLEGAAGLSRHWARQLVEEQADIAFDLSVHVLGSLLGIPDDRLRETAGWVRAFVGCLAPASTPEQIEHGVRAAGNLREMFQELLAGHTLEQTSLLGALASHARQAGLIDMESVVANGIGFLSQAYEATAGLIGNALVRLASDASLRDSLASEPALIEDILLEVLRHDPPVQNTRRFVANDTVIAGQPMRAGNAILVVLAAANRDPAANPDPDRFDIDRLDRSSYTFGAGPHACPGAALAITIARAAVERLLSTGWLPDGTVSYRPSANGRIPVMDWNRSKKQ